MHFEKNANRAPLSDRAPADGARVIELVVKELIEAIKDHKIDSLVIGPYVSTHSVSENDNGAMDRAAKKWSDVSDKTNCAIHISHHVKKLRGAEATIEDSRGGIALRDAARIRRVLNVMTIAEANETVVPLEERGQYVSAVDAGSSMKKSSFAKQWTRLVSVDLGNAKPPFRADNVGVVERWEYKKVATVLALDMATDVLDKLKSQGPWRASPQADEWLGRAVAAAAGLDLKETDDRKAVVGQIAEWIKDGTLIEFKGVDGKANPRPMIGWPPIADVGADFPDDHEKEDIDFG